MTDNNPLFDKLAISAVAQKVLGEQSQILTQFSDEMVKHLHASFTTILEPHQNSIRLFQEAQFGQLKRTLAEIAEYTARRDNEVDQLLALAHEHVPANLRGIERGSMIYRAVGLAGMSGVPLAWVVPPLLAQAFAEDSSTTRAVDLVMRERVAIIEHCATVIEDVDEPGRSVLAQALDALETGMPHAAQALAASLVEEVIWQNHHDPSKPQNLTAPRESAKSWADTDLVVETANMFGRILVYQPMPTVLERWYPGDPTPETFNRHATAHAITQTGIVTHETSLCAVMLALSLSREHNPQLTREHNPQLTPEP